MSAKTVSETDFPHGDMWVFGYGSLIWNPGFSFLEQKAARLIGEHRSLCIYSMAHRGTSEKPGLVLGLDRGGVCQGVAFRVAHDERKATVAYLREREQVTGVYREVMRSVRLKDGERVRALTYVADRSHAQYAGRLSFEEQLRLVRQGHGNYGPNTDYVIATVKALEDQGIRDVQLHQLATQLKTTQPANNDLLMRRD